MPADPEWLIATDEEMRALGARLIDACDGGGVITLAGELGSGKTTLVRGALEKRGVRDGVRSPTYTLIELYPFADITLAHFDLYRLGDPEELEFLGFRDYLNARTLCLIEWPERARGLLQGVDLEIHLAYDPAGRRVQLAAASARGREWLARLARTMPA